MMSNEERKRLCYERQSAVRKAWKEEQVRVSEGYGTRRWTKDEQKEILERGAVKGYEGHHMKSVSLYPEYAGDSNNIQFLNEEEHLYGAHKGDYHNLTNGYYDPDTQMMNEFDDNLEELPIYDLLTYEKVNMVDNIRASYIEDSENETIGSIDIDIKDIRNDYCNCDCSSENNSVELSNLDGKTNERSR